MGRIVRNMFLKIKIENLFDVLHMKERHKAPETTLVNALIRYYKFHPILKHRETLCDELQAHIAALCLVEASKFR